MIITAGDSETGAWCPVCQLDTRVRVPLLADGEPAAILEVCPGCGTGHDQAAAYVTGQGEDFPQARKPARGGFAFLRGPAGRPLCAYRHCARRSRRVVYGFDGDDGLVTFFFCRKAHRAAWCQENGLILP